MAGLTSFAVRWVEQLLERYNAFGPKNLGTGGRAMARRVHVDEPIANNHFESLADLDATGRPAQLASGPGRSAGRISSPRTELRSLERVSGRIGELWRRAMNANAPADMSSKDDIARVAHAIWEAEGRPEGCDHEHWTRAKQLLMEGRAEIAYPESAVSEPPSGVDDRPSLRKPMR